jgi:hypothetical protein
MVFVFVVSMLVAMVMLSRSSSAVSMPTLSREVETNIEMAVTRNFLICKLMTCKTTYILGISAAFLDMK